MCLLFGRSCLVSWTSTLCRSIVCRLTSTAVAKTMGAAVTSVCPTQGAPPAPAPLASGCREMAEPVTQVGPCLGYCAFMIIVFMGCRCLPNTEGTSCTCPTSLDSTARDTGGPCLGYCVCIVVIVFMSCPCLSNPEGTSCTSLDSRTCGALFGLQSWSLSLWDVPVCWTQREPLAPAPPALIAEPVTLVGPCLVTVFVIIVFLLNLRSPPGLALGHREVAEYVTLKGLLSGLYE